MWQLLYHLVHDGGFWLVLESSRRADLEDHVARHLNVRFDQWTIVEKPSVVVDADAQINSARRWFASLEQANWVDAKRKSTVPARRERTAQTHAQYMEHICSLLASVSEDHDGHQQQQLEHKAFDAKLPPTVLLLGDSIFERLNLQGGRVLTAAVGGDRTEHLLWRLEHGNQELLRHVQRLGSIRQVVILIGHNNLERDSPLEVLAGIEAILDRIHQSAWWRGARPKLTVLPVPPCAPSPTGKYTKQRRQAEFFAKLASVNRMLHAVGGQGAFFAGIEHGRQEPALYEDHVHFNAKGNDILLERLQALMQQQVSP